ncbi:hypothetical protein BFP72_02905 [Reichenbachiella sp. 5M10]|nr:hypothetical protein BFP72_02905 [Reichenbachiella sp. 5M10]
MTVPQTFAADYTVNSASQFNALSLSPGDVVTWIDGTYSNDANITFTANGTASNPIILKAESPGGVVFTGEMTMDISGDYVIVDGFYWNGGASANNHVEFRKSSAYANNSTIRNCAFNNLTPSGTDKHRWIVFYGTNNTVENCSFLNKNSPGALLLVELEYNDFSPVGHQIRNNYFYNYVKRDPSTTHSGDSETIRVGTSEFQDKSASVTVEGNYFYKADGENEIITNKSANNTYRNNTFRRCRGSLVMRHGASATVEGNFFLGEGVEGTGGIRITDSYHVITNNYFQDLISTGDKWNNGITLVGGSSTSGGTDNGYQKVDDIVIAFNTLYNVESPIFYNDRSSYDPTGILAYNLVYSTLSDIVGGDISGTGQGMTYEGNLFGGSTIGISNSGITEGNANFSASGEIFKPNSSGLAANAAGSSYSATVNFDIEGRTRPNSNMDIGAHEVSGGSGSATFAPHTHNMVGVSVGACFLDATGGSLSQCGVVSDYLTVSTLDEFTSAAGDKTATISANVNWSAVTSQSWITISPSNGSNNGHLTVSVSANSSASPRTGSVTVSGTGVSASTILVNQAGYSAPIAVTGVSLSPSTATIGIGGTLQLSAAVSPTNALNQQVSYSSSNTSVATVNNAGVVAAVSVGTATITVTTDDGSYTDNSTVTVTAPSTNTNLAESKPISGTGTADGSNIVENLVDGSTTTRWSVSGFPQTATIDLGAIYSLESTEVTCYNDRAYQYTVSVSTDGSNYSQVVDRSSNSTPGTDSSPIIDNFSAVNGRYIQVTVTGAEVYTGSWVSLTEFRIFGEAVTNTVDVSSVSLSPSSVTLFVNDTQQLSATVSPYNASNQDISYSSSNTAVATVNGSGLVTAQGTGSATITVTTDDGGYTASSTITVTPVQTNSNVALYKTATSSSEQSHNPASHLVDGDPDSRWSAQTYPQWVVVDLGSIHTINGTEVICYNDRAYQYTIEASSDGSNYAQIVNRSSNTTGGSNSAPISDSFASTNARYIRLSVSGANGYSGDWASIEELRVFGYSAARILSDHTESVSLDLTPKLSAYPVPATNVLHVVLATPEDFQKLEILDMMGRILHATKVSNETTTLDVSNLHQGMFFVRAYKNDNSIEILRFSK